MARRKVLPYHASIAVDMAKIDLEDLLRELRFLVERESTYEQRYMRLARAIDLAHRCRDHLADVRVADGE